MPGHVSPLPALALELGALVLLLAAHAALPLAREYMPRLLVLLACLATAAEAAARLRARLWAGAPTQGGEMAYEPIGDDREDGDEERACDEEGEDAAAQAEGGAAHAQRVHYADNLRALLTAVVVNHHVLGVFGGGSWYISLGHYRSVLRDVVDSYVMLVDQSFFMALFFFIAGVFTAPSYARKGRRAFLRDRLMRLGVPLVAYTFCLSPLTQVLSSLARRAAVEVAPEPGPCWFVLWLLIFSCAYAVLPHENSDPAAEPRPLFFTGNVWATIGVGAGMGNVQIAVIVATGGSFLCMPISVGSLPYDVAFFAAGCLAKRNGWLEALAAKRRDGVHVFNAGVLAALWIVHAVAYAFGHSAGELWKIPQAGAGLVVVCGALTVSLSVGMLDFARRALDRSTAWTKWFTQAAYTVYVIHPPVIGLVAWSAICLVGMVEGAPLPASAFGPDAEALKHPWVLYAAWVYTATLSQALVWPLAHAISRVPCFQGVLV